MLSLFSHVFSGWFAANVSCNAEVDFRRLACEGDRWDVFGGDADQGGEDPSVWLWWSNKMQEAVPCTAVLLTFQ